MITETIQIISNIIIVALLLFLIFSKNYIAQKAKNLATKEDISTITKLVEEVKHNFTKEAEFLKANLQFLTNVQVGIESEERNAIIDCNMKYFRWLNILSDASFNNVDILKSDELEIYSQRIGKNYRDFEDSETKFGLFVENQELENCLGELKIKTLELLNTMPQICAVELIHLNRDENHLRENTIITIEDKRKQYDDILNKRFEILKKMNNHVLENYKTVYAIGIKFQRLSRDYIYKLLHEKVFPATKIP